MSDVDDDTPGWARALAKRVDGLAEAVEQQRQAKTAGERREASSEVSRETSALRELGLTREEVDKLKREQRRAEMREVLEELLAEREAASEEGSDEDDAETVTSLRDAAAKRSQGRKVKPPPEPVPDVEPVAGESDQPKTLVQRLGLG